MPTTLISIGPVIPVLAGVTYAIPDVLVTIESGPVQYSKVYGSGYASLVGSGPIRWGFIRPSGDTTVKLTRIPWNGKSSSGNPLPSDDYSYANRVILDGAIAYWKLNESSGLVARDSVGNAHGTISGGVLQGQVGVIDSCMKFDGVDDKIQVNTIIPLICTIEGWLNQPNTVLPLLSSRNVGTGDTIVVGLDTTHAFASSGSGVPYVVGAITIPYGSWTHVAFVFDGVVVSLYVNGILDKTVAFVRTIPGSGLCNIGWDQGFTAGIGLIDDVAIYNKALTPAQILAHYNSRSPTQATSYSNLVRQHGASNYWRLGEISGLVATDSIGGANGTISGGVSLNQEGAVSNDKAMTFDGVDDKVVTPATVKFLTPFTLEWWMRTVAITSDRVILSIRSGGSGGNFVINMSGGKLYVYSSAGGTGLGSKIVNDGVWHHVCMILDGTNAVSIYTDGIFTPVSPFDGGAYGAGSTNRPLEIGSDITGPTFYNGSIDEVAIYPRALSAQEILQHYQASNKSVQAPIPYSQIVLNDKPSNYWRLNELTGLVAADVIGGAHGTISGGVTLGQAGALSDDKGMVFDGVNGQVQKSSIPIPRTSTFELWLKGSVASVYFFCVGIPEWFIVGLNSAGKITVNSLDTYAFTGTRTINDNVWHHVVMISQPIGMQFYIDGVVDPPAGIIPWSTSVPFSGTIYIGSILHQTGFWNGSIDEVAIYPYALTPQQIANHYRARR